MTMRPTNVTPAPCRRHPHHGFSLMELMITLLIFTFLAGAVITVLVVSSKQKSATSNEVGATQMARTTVDMLTRDLRTAGFGIDNTYTTPQPAVAYVDSQEIIINSNVTPYPDTSTTARGIPLAYNPTGSPKPKPLNGTAWTPPIRYRTGAECVRWTLDLNNDGQVNATDLSASDATDAARTSNPDDYELCREVYGDSTGGSQGNNGGTRERIGLIKKPGGSNPPLFRVYMQGSSTPWNWANGPVPANKLQEIVRIEVNIVSTSPTKNFMGQYTDRRITTTVNELRNSPNFSFITYNISGFVYNDLNKNRVKDGGEVGVAGAAVTVGGYLSMTTSATGGFSFDVPAGTYSVTQDPPANFGIFTSPDSFNVTVGPNITCNFADTARAGGWVNLTVYNDVDKSRSYGGSDKAMVDLAVTLMGTNEVYNTDNNGVVSVFCPVGTYKLSAALPDSFVFSTTNPATGTMTNGATQTKQTGMYIFDSGNVAGTVFVDTDADGVLDVGENGIQGAYVYCYLPDSTLIYSYTDGNGAYALKLPTNDPPKTTPYNVVCDPPDGYTSQSALSIPTVYVQTNKTLSNQNFAMSKFNVWVQDVPEAFSAVTAIATDFIENDWTGVQSKHARKDLDFVTGTDEGALSNVQQWFNQYDKTPILHNSPDINRSAVNSVYALAADTLDAGVGGVSRPDVIAGMRYRASGNWTIWFSQNTSGNEGFIPTTASQSYLTADNGDVTAIVTVPPAVGASADIIVGTKSPTSGNGTIEIWRTSSHSSPSYTRAQTISGIGEVTALALGDLNTTVTGPELAVGTLTGYYTGELRVYKLVSGTWTLDWSTTLGADAVTCLTITDVNDDNKKDLVVGTQSSHTTGHLIWYERNANTNFKTPVTRNASGIVTALNKSDYGADGIDDIIVGWRGSDILFTGGLEIWYTTAKTLPTSGQDASGGKITNWITGIDIGNYNYGVWPSTPSSPYYMDIAGVARKDSKNGKVFTLVR